MILIMQKSCVVYDGKENKAPRLNIVVLQKRWEEKNNDLPLPPHQLHLTDFYLDYIPEIFISKCSIPIKSLPK